MFQRTFPGERPLNSEGVWCQILALPAPGRPALFLDRDGVVVEEAGYLSCVQDVGIIPGAAEVIPLPTNAEFLS